jgi:hypothetical protein
MQKESAGLYVRLSIYPLVGDFGQLWNGINAANKFHGEVKHKLHKSKISSE